MTSFGYDAKSIGGKPAGRMSAAEAEPHAKR